MSHEDRRARLLRLTEEAARRDAGAAERGAGPPPSPAPGDLFVLPATADFPVEWAVIEVGESEPASILAAPADTNPLLGGGDVWIPVGEPGGPLALRCRFATRLTGRTLAKGRRTGRIPEEARSRALERWRSHLRGEIQADGLEQEVEADPEYRDWERHVLAPAVAAATGAAAAPSGEPASRSSWRPALLALAAGLALLVLGLGSWSWRLREEVRRLSEPAVLSRSHEVLVGAEPRGPITLRAAPDEERLLVFLVLSDDQRHFERHRIELAGAGGRLLWKSGPVERGPLPEITLVVPRELFDRAGGELLLRLYGIDNGGERPLAEVPVRLERMEREL